MAMHKLKLQALVERAKQQHAEKIARDAALAEEKKGSASGSAPGKDHGGIGTNGTAHNGVATNGTNILHLHPTSPRVGSAPISVLTQPPVAKLFTADGGVFHPVIPGFEYNEKQLQAIELGIRGKSFNLIGAAGTGKTTTTREIIGQVVKLPQCLPVKNSTKYLQSGSPGVVIISFTNKAVNNIKKFLPEELKRHCLTIHSLLEFKPLRSFNDLELEGREVNGNFMPTFHKDNKLPHISIVIVEESSMVGWEDHWKWVIDALPRPNETQFIFLGDINQLPPIFGPSVLGFKMLELPTVELTHVYRQALESPIITLAHKMREGRGVGKLVPIDEHGKGGFFDDRGVHGKVTIHPWKKKLEPVPACKTVQNFVTKLHQAGEYDPETDIILCPFNKTFGTVELNKGIADYFGRLRGALVWEVCSRGMFSYWAVGDRVLVDRQEAIVTLIEETPNYSGRQPDEPSTTLNRWGKDPNRKRHEREDDADKSILIAKGHSVLDTLEVGDDAEAGKNTASHTITVEFCDTGIKRILSSSGDVNAMQFAYALTVHKSQGSEWRKVFIFLHYTHNTMMTRELMYTAITRAKQELFIICEPDRGEIYNSLTRAAKSPEIHGVTLQEKAEYFRRKQKSMKRLADRQAQQAEQQQLEEED